MKTKTKVINNKYYNEDNRLREYLMTGFLVTIVYELISKPYISYIFTTQLICKEFKTWPSLIIWNSINQDAMKIMFENIISQLICTFSSILPKWLYSSLPWANENLAITVFSIAVTWFSIWIIFRISKWLYTFKKVRKYMRAEPRKELYTDDFWWKLLLTFWMFSIILLPLYPTFGTIVWLIIFNEIMDRHNNKANLN